MPKTSHTFSHLILTSIFEGGFFLISMLKKLGFHFAVVVQLLSHVQLFCNHMDCNPPGSSVHGISQGRILEQVAISFCRGFSQPRDQTRVSYLAGGFFTTEPPTWKALAFISLKYIFAQEANLIINQTRVTVEDRLHFVVKKKSREVFSVWRKLVFRQLYFHLVLILLLYTSVLPLFQSPFLLPHIITF